MTVVLQGGGEFSPGCRAMDKLLLDLADGPLVVTALAGEVGRDYRKATDNGVSHFRALGGSHVVAAPDVREESAQALVVLRTARVIVLPGGSPSRLLTALTASPVGQVIADLLAAGGSVMGASAGAMVLCPWTVLPDRRGPHGLVVAKGLGLCPVSSSSRTGVAAGSRTDWMVAIKDGVPADISVLGLAEESGVLFEDGVLTAVGKLSTRLVGDAQELPVGQSWRIP